ncbi:MULTISPECIES: bifunctional (p)ppGpp synthetase/guanosine-3',5'-bis(diphosphate) 3'-pyrophosphohydrolase [Terrabacteria group]|uniref:RelA/SpoT family protein n=1 Tax=Bacillati TaxID=1783272 RepID=UPI00193A073C|nr:MULTISPECIES: bifunctional (p)ppGpp synthetase/guanosine-3',5'-bis(diphosphate) 3'-pyrophosphohydrolase [Terrabacteria group]MBW9212303.1 bifunctional (p)ppGpp synthetase/guanosine-3',5'-bis(diphosphate) 3'-pyrophosphohydrolase [Trueperella sp. zg.1013]QRG86160.1 bifunctional (p)ppGpp synthetase/guanosine-3',5'-bis(diphosphate) 3'-pyrophosphohydrolase [Bulleidia sp. zg-1006]
MKQFMNNPGVSDVLEEAKSYIHQEESLSLIEKAANYAIEKHAGQFRKSGEPYFIHLANVAYILATLRVDPQTISAGFLHDVIEDCGVSKSVLAEDFGEEVASLVESVTKIGTLEYKGKDDPEYQAANHRKIFIAMAKDIRVILIKLCDRLHNMRTLQFQTEASQKRIASETLDVYTPIAHRLGISTIKNELEDLSFYYLNRDEYYRIAHLVEAKKTERDHNVNVMIQNISKILKENHLEFRIFGRSKHLYSIYRKMKKKNKRFDEILDLLAIRIVTKTELNCYEVLGYIHATYKPIPGRLKDYIAVPKPNMYQSLHTTIIGDSGKIFEVQIRTEEMDAIAEKGIAAHWRYKEGTKYDKHTANKEIEAKLSWFKDFAIYSEENSSPSEYMETLQKDIFEANVYVMTPKGRVIDLPSGATPLDFAYRIHTDVGHTTVGAIVNDAMVPLNTTLHTGDVVNIRTQKGTGPSEDWLNVVKTNQAKNKIKAYFQKKESQLKEDRVPDGERLLSEELRKRGFDAKEYMDKAKIMDVCNSMQAQASNYTELMYGIATRNISVSSVAERLTNQKSRVAEDMNLSRSLNKAAVKKVSKSGLVVPGIDSIKMSLAHCCLPVYNDEIVGNITKTEGVKVHRTICPNAKHKGAHLIDVYWGDREVDQTYQTDLLVIASDRNFLLTDIVTVVSQCRLNLEAINATTNHETLTARFTMSVRVKNLEQLENLMANIRKIDSILSVERAIY